jgi:hypothetical protein
VPTWFQETLHWFQGTPHSFAIAANARPDGSKNSGPSIHPRNLPCYLDELSALHTPLALKQNKTGADDRDSITGINRRKNPNTARTTPSVPQPDIPRHTEGSEQDLARKMLHMHVQSSHSRSERGQSTGKTHCCRKPFAVLANRRLAGAGGGAERYERPAGAAHPFRGRANAFHVSAEYVRMRHAPAPHPPNPARPFSASYRREKRLISSH